MKYERGSFIVVPSREKLRGMPVPAQALYMWMCAYANEEGECFPSKERLAKDCDCSRDTIDRMTNLLVERGLLKMESRFKGKEQLTNLYTVLIVPPSATAGIPPPMVGVPLPRISGTELNPIITESIYLGATRIVIEKDEEKPNRTPKAKYPHSKEVFSWFTKPEKSWALNITELSHSELLFERGEAKVKGALEFLRKHKGEQFLPKVTKPSDLERKWNDLVSYIP